MNPELLLVNVAQDENHCRHQESPGHYYYCPQLLVKAIPIIMPVVPPAVLARGTIGVKRFFPSEPIFMTDY